MTSTSFRKSSFLWEHSQHCYNLQEREELYSIAYKYCYNGSDVIYSSLPHVSHLSHSMSYIVGLQVFHALSRHFAEYYAENVFHILLIYKVVN